MTAKKNRWRRVWALRRELETSPRDWRRNQLVQMPRRQRLLNWLAEAREIGIRLQVQGGVAYNRDLRELVGRGLLRMARVPRDGLHQEISYAKLLVTDRGLAVLESGRI
jgi:hypothetical protein